VIHLLAALIATIAVAAPVPRVDAVEIVVNDLDAERRFYTQALGFTSVARRPVPGGELERLALGDERLDLVRYDRPGAAISSSARSDDRAFQHIAIIVSDMTSAWSAVVRFPIRRVSVAPQVLPRWNPTAGGIIAVYFRDPEGHPLELLQFPAGKGASKWHAAAPLFLGIDHSAISVADPAASRRFYVRLGLSVRGNSDNYGIEQERLSAVRGAHVEITAVRFGQAPGVEFLHYVEPARRQQRESARANDLEATRTIFIERRAAALCAGLTDVRRTSTGCLARDPDGHLIEIRSAS
jgi:catechol 2,3-dioxygenase-like lactoylglutathione lyase family enzyme